jgi:hypothetical protein
VVDGLAEDGADERGDADRRHGVVDDLVGVGVAEGVDVAGVLRPDDDVRAREARPAATRFARSIVALAWLSRTARRSALNSSPARGRCPGRRRPDRA